uniref:SWIM-type domain-containing protein n=1 Tax=Angiostrongylus cantonensis TaxID=6313 RepID=A0A0K0DPQ0_ANGCA
MSGEDDWLVQAAAQEAGMLHLAPDSFEDSDRFEGDSECSWVSSESITLAKNWRGWSHCSPDDNLQSELERNYRDICQKKEHISEIPVAHSLPDKLFLSIVYWCFPATADDIRLYRCRIVSCDCSCASKSAWCQHVVALCLYRIHQPNEVQFRVTIWDSVNELSMAKLKKFAQYLVNELPKEYLPVAQRLLDQLKCSESEINRSPGAPDPTDGGHEKNAIWALDVEGLHTSIRRLLIKYCVPSPTYLGTAQHPIAAEWLTIMKSLRAREPEGIWNLMAIVREMFARRDENAVSLLSILTVECLANCQVLLWWYATKLVQGGNWSQQTTG